MLQDLDNLISKLNDGDTYNVNYHIYNDVIFVNVSQKPEHHGLGFQLKLAKNIDEKTFGSELYMNEGVFTDLDTSASQMIKELRELAKVEDDLITAYTKKMKLTEDNYF